jgi:hypothetical protein
VTRRPKAADGWLRFDCSTPDCSWSAWVAAVFDPDGGGREATIRAPRPTCPVCGCRTVPDWLEGPRLGPPESAG